MLFCGIMTSQVMDAKDTSFEQKVYNRTSELLRSHTYDENNIVIADSIYKASQEQGSLLGKLCACRLRMYAYILMSDSANLIAATDEASMLAEQMGKIGAYSEAQNVKIHFYIGQEHYIKAKQLTEEMLAKSSGSPKMLMQSYSLMANIYQSQDMQKVAIQYYEKALEYIEKTDSINYCLLYRGMAECYTVMEDSEHALEYAKKALEMAGTEGVYYYWSAFTYLYTLYETKDYDAFLSEYKRINLLEFPIEGVLPQYVQNQLLMRYEIIHGNYEKALILAEDIEYKSLRIPAIIEVYRKWGEWEKALEYTDMYNTYEDSIRTQMNMDAMMEVDALLGLDKLKLDKQELEVRNQRTTLVSIICIILVCLVAVTYLFIRRRAHIRELNAKNDELEEKNLRLNSQNEELIAARDEAERSSKMKTRFIQNITHEIRTPLHAISGFSQILSENVTAEERKEYIDIIVDNTTAVTTMLSDILLLSELDNRTARMDIAEVAANTPLTTAYETAKETVPQEIAFVCKAELDDTIKVNIDHNLMQTALRKVIENAIKFTQSGSITLCSQLTPERHVIYSVTDTGCGIHEEWRERIFERFEKVDEFVQGVGIGLTICRKAIEAMGGSTYLDTNYTGGARLVIDLPCAET